MESLLRLADVRRRVGLSSTTIYARMAAGDFPQVRRDGGIAFWLESEIDAYVAKVAPHATPPPYPVRMNRKQAEQALAKLDAIPARNWRERVRKPA